MSTEPANSMSSLPDAAERSAEAGGETSAKGVHWEAPQLVAWPRFTRLAVVVAAAALAWLMVELLWPGPAIDGPVTLTAARATAPADDDTVYSEESFVRVFSARKLFVPEVAVESREMSRAVIEQMVSRMKLTAVIEQSGDLVAWVELQGAGGTSANPFRASSSNPQGTRMLQVRRGDMIGDFKVDEVTSEGVDLSVAGFQVRLNY